MPINAKFIFQDGLCSWPASPLCLLAHGLLKLPDLNDLLGEGSQLPHDCSTPGCKRLLCFAQSQQIIGQAFSRGLYVYLLDFLLLELQPFSCTQPLASFLLFFSNTILCRGLTRKSLLLACRHFSSSLALASHKCTGLELSMTSSGC